MYAFYIILHIFVGAVAPLFFAVLLPLSTASTLIYVDKWQNLTSSLEHPVFKISVLMIVLVILSSFYSLAPSHSFKDAAQFSLLLLSFSLLWGLKTNIKNELTQKQKKLILHVFLTSLVIIIGLNILVQQGWLQWKSYAFNRALVTLTLIFWPLSLYYYNEKENQWLLWLVYGLIIANILVGVSETALLVLITSSLTYLLFRGINGSLNFRTSIFAVGITLISLMPSVIAYMQNPIIVQYATPLIGSKLEHYKIWVASIQNAIQNFPMGIGINTTRLFNTDEVIANRGFSVHHAHNLQIELFLELGIIGIIFSILLIFAAVRLYYKTPKLYQPIIAATLVAIFIFYALSFSVWQEWRNALIAFVLIVMQRFLSEQRS